MHPLFLHLAFLLLCFTAIEWRLSLLILASPIHRANYPNVGAVVAEYGPILTFIFGPLLFASLGIAISSLVTLFLPVIGGMILGGLVLLWLWAILQDLRVLSAFP